MSDINFVKVKLDKIINFPLCKSNGSNFTKSFINANKGDIPVYGASNNENEVSYGYVSDELTIKDKSGKEIKVKYFNDCLTWNIDGSIAIFYRKGKFSLSEKVIPLVLFEELKDNIDLDYLKFCISQSKEINDFGFANKAGKSRLKEVVIPLPVNNSGEYDIEIQKEIANKYHNIELRKEKLEQYQNQLKEMLIKADFSKNYNHKEVKLTDLFNPVRGKSKYTKTYCFKNKGEYPVYSANNSVPLAYANFYDYDGEYLTVSVNGIAGKLTSKSGKFSINADRIILEPIADGVSNDFIKYTIEPLLRSKIKGRMGHDGQNEFTKLPSGIIENVRILMPVMSDGQYDLEAQREIAKKFEKLYQVKSGICDKIERLVGMHISLGEE